MNAEEVKRLLPWYVVDALDPAERREVESELHCSAELRRELAQVRALGDAVRAGDDAVPEFRASLIDEALQRIDAFESTKSDPRPKATVTVLDRFRRTVTGDWSAASGVTRFALAAQFALIFVMAGFLLMPATREETSSVTASGSGPVNGRSVAHGPQFSVVFVPEASLGRIAEFLEGQGLQIVSGPGELQAYVVTAGEQANAEEALRKLLEARDVVRYARPAAP